MKINDSQDSLRKYQELFETIHNVEEFYIDKYQGFVTKEFKKLNENTSYEDSGTSWLNSNVTFKLELEDDEKRARSELVLPYLNESHYTIECPFESDGFMFRQKGMRSIHLNRGSQPKDVCRQLSRETSDQPKVAQIIYEPDANDDWDEEDPDDDLNI